MNVLVRSRKTLVGLSIGRVHLVRIEKIDGVSCLVVYDYFGRVHGADGSMPTEEYRIEQVIDK